MLATTLNFRYKGSRTYVHGTDMYNQIIDVVLGEFPDLTGAEFRLTVHDLMHTHGRMICRPWQDDVVRPEGAVAEFHMAAVDRKLIGWLIETDNAVTERYEYKESEIAGKSIVSGQSVSIKGEVPHTAIEILVAINKHLHETLFPDAQGKWFFTRLELDHLLPTDKEADFTLELVQNLHNRLTKSKIISRGQYWGNIYFSLVKPT